MKSCNENDRAMVIGFARELAAAKDMSTAVEATEIRGWLDRAGTLTREGRTLALALTAKLNIRSAVPNN